MTTRQSTFRALTELVRLPLTPTALADSMAGYAIAATLHGEGFPVTAFSSPRLALVLIVSVLTYWLGMATNDIFDIRRDRRIAGTRPLPSGALGLRGAIIFSVLLFMGAGECPFGMSEQNALGQIMGQRGTVHNNKGFGLADAVKVDRLGK